MSPALKHRIPSGRRMMVKHKQIATKKRMIASGILMNNQNPVSKRPPVMVNPIQRRSPSTAKTIKKRKKRIM